MVLQLKLSAEQETEGGLVAAVPPSAQDTQLDPEEPCRRALNHWSSQTSYQKRQSRPAWCRTCGATSGPQPGFLRTITAADPSPLAGGTFGDVNQLQRIKVQQIKWCGWWNQAFPFFFFFFNHWPKDSRQGRSTTSVELNRCISEEKQSHLLMAKRTHLQSSAPC